MSRPVIVLGAGGHGRSVVDALLAAGTQVLGAVDPEPADGRGAPLRVPLLGDDEALDAYGWESVLLAMGVGSVAPGGRRRLLFEHWRSRGYGFTAVRHPSAVVAVDVEVEAEGGAQVLAGSVVQPGVRLGRNVLVNTSASVDHDCVLGDHVHIAPGAVLSGGVHVEEDSHVGTGACVVQGVTIGRGSLIGAGAVVTRDVPAGTRVRAGTRTDGRTG